MSLEPRDIENPSAEEDFRKQLRKDKMKNSEQPVHPTTLRQIGENEYRVASEKDIKANEYLTHLSGLTKLELFAKDIFCARIYKSFNHPIDHAIYKLSIEDAKELLRQLETV